MVCTECGERFPRRSQFEMQCPECGSEELAEEDAYDDETLQLRCGECGYEVDGATPGTAFAAEAGRYTVDDACPRCGLLELADQAQAKRGSRDAPELGLARLAARRLLDTHWDGALPVDVEAIAGAEGVRVEIGGFGHDGQLVDNVIEVPRTSPQAERFVIAHELGHRELGHRVPEARIEQEANAFASELLMPTTAVRAAARERRTLSDLCLQFAVSRQAMTYALQHARVLALVQSR